MKNIFEFIVDYETGCTSELDEHWYRLENLRKGKNKWFHGVPVLTPALHICSFEQTH